MQYTEHVMHDYIKEKYGFETYACGLCQSWVMPAACARAGCHAQTRSLPATMYKHFKTLRLRWFRQAESSLTS
jgi:hypothetical protein